MKWIFYSVIFLFTSTGCDRDNREKALQLKLAEVDQKEQDLLAREKSIQLREEELLKREKLLDSASRNNMPDTLSTLHPDLPGLYNVTMKCTETSCPGSAVGDTQNEQWEIGFENNSVIIKAMSDKKLVRIYKGSYIGNSIELSAQPENMAAPQAGIIIVRLQETKENGLEGLREVTRQEDCRIIYDLDFQKK